MHSLTAQWQEITGLEVDPNDIAYVVQEMSGRRERSEGDDFFTSIAILGDRFRGQQRSADRMFCISTRMECFLEMVKDDRMRGWTIETCGQVYTLATGAVFHAIAGCTLRVEEDRFYFDADEFFRIALEEIEPEGHA